MSAHSNFPSGNGRDFTRVGPDHFAFDVDRHGGEWGLWFYFAVDGAAGRRLTFDLRNATQLLGWPEFWRGVRVVCDRDGTGHWKRTDEDGEVLVEAGIFRFHVTGGERQRVAFAFPYTLRELHEFRERFRRLPGAIEQRVATSLRGHPVDAWQLGCGPAGVWLLGRTHASETPASFVLEGFLEAAAAMRERLTVRVCPMLDVDNVEAGAFGKFGPPCDPARDWNESPVLPQTAALQRYFAAAPERPLIVIDLHSPLPNHPTFACTWNEPEIAPDQFALLERFTAALCECSRPPLEFDLAMTRGYPEWFGGKFEQSAQGWFHRRFDCPTLTMEIGYQRAGIPEYREFGRALAWAAQAIAKEGIRWA